MRKLGPWLVVLVLAVVVVGYYVKYVRGSGPGKSVTEGEAAEKTERVEDASQDPGMVEADPTPDPGGLTEQENETEEEPDSDGPTSSQLFLQAQEAEKKGDVAAVELYRRVVSKDPRSEEAVQAAAKLGTYYHQTQEAARAIQYLKIALAGNLADEQREELRKKLDELSSEQIFDLETNPRASYYEVMPGDNLSKIAKQYQIPWELLVRLNHLKSTNIRPGERLKVIKGPFDAVVEKGKFRLSVYLGKKYVKSYKVGIGKDDTTPAGAFTVESKLKNPDWIRPGKITKFGDPDNLLGTRWIGFLKGYGIHGTWEPETIGSQCSEGCLRMLNEDVEELFDLLVRSRSKVTVRK